MGNSRGISRRSFLVATGVGGMAAAVAACSTGGNPVAVATSASATATHPVPPPVSTSATSRAIDYPALARKLSGRLVLPDSSGYALARRSYNPLYDERRPAAVALCTRTADVQACVSAAAASRTPLAARSGCGLQHPGQGAGGRPGGHVRRAREQ